VSARGHYGNVASPQQQKRGGRITVAVVAGVAAGIYALSPGMRYFYKHGHLPLAPRASHA